MNEGGCYKGNGLLAGLQNTIEMQNEWPRVAEASAGLQKGEDGQQCRVNYNEISGPFRGGTNVLSLPQLTGVLHRSICKHTHTCAYTH